MGKRGGGRRHASSVRGNPVNLRVGCGTQQAREPVGGGNRRGREERRGRNERGAGRRRAEAGESPREWTPAGVSTERRSLRTLGKALGFVQAGRLRNASPIRIRQHAASNADASPRCAHAGHDDPLVSVHARSRRGPSPGKSNDPEPRAAKRSITMWALEHGWSHTLGGMRWALCPALIAPTRTHSKGTPDLHHVNSPGRRKAPGGCPFGGALFGVAAWHRACRRLRGHTWR